MSHIKTEGFYGFYLLVSTVPCLERFLALGVKTIQLRVKPFPSSSDIARALEAGKRFEAQVVINDAWQEAQRQGASYIHLGQEDLQSLDQDLVSFSQVGLSTHTPEELDHALSVSPAYVALGPIFPTTSKEVHFPPQGIRRIRHWKKRAGSCPLVALGGVTLERAPELLSAGADALAVIGDVVNSPSPEKRVEAWLRFFEDR